MKVWILLAMAVLVHGQSNAEEDVAVRNNNLMRFFPFWNNKNKKDDKYDKTDKYEEDYMTPKPKPKPPMKPYAKPYKYPARPYYPTTKVRPINILLNIPAVPAMARPADTFYTTRAPYNPATALYTPTPAPYSSTPAPYYTTPAPYYTTPAPYYVTQAPYITMAPYTQPAPTPSTTPQYLSTPRPYYLGVPNSPLPLLEP